LGLNPETRSWIPPKIGLEEGVVGIKSALQAGLIRANPAAVRLNGYRKLVEEMQFENAEQTRLSPWTLPPSTPAASAGSA
jgi:hypothetical protein